MNRIIHGPIAMGAGLPLGLAALIAAALPARGQEAVAEPASIRAASAQALPGGIGDSLEALLARQEPGRRRELEERYQESGETEKRLLEERFELFEHHYRVNADPRGIVRSYLAEGLDGQALEGALAEVVAGRYSAYYFFDGVIRPNVFAPERYLGRRESALHEKVHLIQPSLYRALGLHCRWRDRRDPCMRSLEPVAVFLTEFAILKHASTGRSDASINRAIESHLALEAMRCGYGEPVSRCPGAERIREYVLEPLQLAREVIRHGLEEGIRRYVEGLTAADVATLAADL